MDYLRRVFRTILAPTVRWLDATAIVLTPIAKAFGGDVMTEDQIALYIIYLVGAALVVRIVSAPYLIWKEDQETIRQLRVEVEKPERERKNIRQVRDVIQREETWSCASLLLNKTREFMQTYSAANSETKNRIFEEWRTERRRFSEKADEFLSEEHIYETAQDLINRCDIVVDESRGSGEPFKHFPEAREVARALKRELDQ